MASFSSDVQDSQKRRKARPSRGRGLRTTTGCLTCRKRRLKCSEEKPSCNQCLRSERDCHYTENLVDNSSPTDSKRGSWGSRDAEFPPRASLTESSTDGLKSPQDHRSLSFGTSTTILPVSTYSTKGDEANLRNASASNAETIQQPISNVRHVSQSTFSPVPSLNSMITSYKGNGPSPTSITLSPLTQSASLTPGRAPYVWLDQIAHDAIQSSHNYQVLKESHSRWSFDPVDFTKSSTSSPSQFLFDNGRQVSPEQASSIRRPSFVGGHGAGSKLDDVAKEPWNTTEPPRLSRKELEYLKYYIEVVGPIFDMFDSNRTWTELVPHLAMRNDGLLKSVLAVSARFKSLHSYDHPVDDDGSGTGSTEPPFSSDDDVAATEFYFETLSYLSHAIKYPNYAKSSTILATATLISSYEYFHVNRSLDWERHLKGVFWIQRSQDTNGEREGLAGAVWWNWLRQDIWAALWQKRRPLTIWEYTKPVESLKGHEFASRATFLLAKAIRYAYPDVQNAEITQRLSEGEKLLQELQDWFDHMPSSYRPLPVAREDSADPAAFWPALWVHPPYHAAAMQNYYSATIMLLLHRPSIGGVNAYHDVPRMLDEAVDMICGLAQSHTAFEYPSAMVNFQALYVAGHCVRTSEQQAALYRIFSRTLDFNRFPTKSLLSDLQKVWQAI